MGELWLGPSRETNCGGEFPDGDSGSDYYHWNFSFFLTSFGKGERLIMVFIRPKIFSDLFVNLAGGFFLALLIPPVFFSHQGLLEVILLMLRLLVAGFSFLFGAEFVLRREGETL